MQYFNFKDPQEVFEITQIHPKLGHILFDMVDYCYFKKVPFVITCMNRTPEENDHVGAKSQTHVEGRAFDLSIKGWDLFFIDEFCAHFNEKYKSAATPVALFHEGTAPHIHVQVFRLASI